MNNATEPSLQGAALAALRGEAPPMEQAPREQIRQFRALGRIAELCRLFAAPSQATLGDAPAQWGHLRIERRIGEGAFGEVFRAHDTVLHRDVSLKLQRRDRASEDAATYIAEARRLARVRHPNVMAIHGADVHDGRVGLWADLLRGETLAARLGKSRCLEPSGVLDLAGQLAAALTAVHGAGLCHGDIKPANIMCESDGRYVLMDFGAAREHSERGRYHYGTPRFMSPERLREDCPPSASDDLYAVGTVLYRAALGDYPEREHAGEADTRATGSVPRIERARLRRSLGAPLARLLGDLLAEDPSRRPSAVQLRERYRELLALPLRRRRRWVIGLVIGSLSFGLAAALVGLDTARQAGQRETAQRERAEQVGDFLRRWLAAPRAEEYGRQARVLDVLTDAERELDARSNTRADVQAELRLTLAQTLAGLGEEQRARTQVERVLATTAAQLPTLLRLRAQEQLNELDAETAEPAAVIERRQQLLREIENGPHVGSDLHIHVLIGLAESLNSAERSDEAAAALDTAARLAAAPLMEFDDSVGNRLLAARLSLLNGKGDFAAAASVAEQGLQQAIRRYGPHHSAVFVARSKWVEALSQSGRMEAAEAPARENLLAARDFLGDDDRHTLAAATALGNVLYDLGRHTEALEFQREALRRAERIAGISATDRANIRINLANGLKETGSRSEAIALYRQVIETSASEEVHPMAVLMCRSNLAEALVEDAQFDAAAEVASDTLTRMRDTLGDQHPFVGHAQAMLGAALTGRGDGAAGLVQLNAARQVVADSIGLDNPLAFDIDWYRSGALAASGQPAAARAALQQLLQAQTRVLGAAHPDTRRSAYRLQSAAGDN